MGLDLLYRAGLLSIAGLVGGLHGASVVAGHGGRERRAGGDVPPIQLPLIGEAGRGPEQERREQVGRPRPVLAGEFLPHLGSAGDRRTHGVHRRLHQRGEERCAFAAEQGRDRAGAVAVPDPDPQAGRPAGPVDLVRCWVDRWPARRRAVEQGLCGAHGAAPQGPDPDRAGVEVGPVDLARRGVGRDPDRVVLPAKQALGEARAVQIAGPNFVGELVRPVDLVVRGVDRDSARGAPGRVCEQGQGRPRAVQVADPDLIGAEVGPVDLASRGINRDAAHVPELGEQGRGAPQRAVQVGDPDLTRVPVGPVDLAGRGVSRDPARSAAVVEQGLGGGRAAIVAGQGPEPNRVVSLLPGPVDAVCGARARGQEQRDQHGEKPRRAEKCQTSVLCRFHS